MLLIFFLVSFNYNVLRTMKDSLIVTAKGSGAEVIPFVKVWMMFPGAVLLTGIYTALSNRFSQETVFYSMMGLFLGFFTLFITVLYPLREQLHAHQLANWMEQHLASGWAGMIAMVRYWSFTAFYVMAELWGCIILFTLFWGFANQITSVNEAKRFYGLFGIGANFSGVAAGMCSMALIRLGAQVPLPIVAPGDRWLVLQILVLVVSGLCTLAVYRWMNRSVLTDSRYYDPQKAVEHKRVRGSISLRESFAYLARSRYLLCIAVIVLGYNVVINLVEVVWKHQVRELYPSTEDYTFYMNQVMTAIGIIATLTALFFTGNSIRRFGWTTTAMVTPVVLLVTSIFFFYFFLCKECMLGLAAFLQGTATPMIVVFLGSMQNIVSRAAKYTVFDATKELAFVPLSTECKIKGKAAIDGVCSRLGKSGGSVIHQFFLLVTSGSVVASAPYIAACLFVIIGLWIVATMTLGRRFEVLTEEQRQGLPISLSEDEKVAKQEESAVLQEQQAVV